MNNSSTYIGTELKLNISIDKIADYTMDDYEFDVEFYCYSNRRLAMSKEALIRKDENNYLAVVDSKSLGAGMVKCKITAYIPDADCNDGTRVEVCLVDTGILVTGA